MSIYINSELTYPQLKSKITDTFGKKHFNMYFKMKIPFYYDKNMNEKVNLYIDEILKYMTK